MASELSSADLALLIRAAKAAGINPAKLKAANPWSFQTGTALALQAAVAELDPATAERLQTEAGVDLSLGAAAALEGVGGWTPELEAEVQTRRPETYQRLQAEALKAAEDEAFSGWRQQEAEALELAAQYGYNSARLLELGHSLAARKAAQHLEQQRQQQEAERRNAWSFLRG